MASMYELEGTVKLVLETQTFASGFTKRDFVVTTTDDKYPQDIRLECVKEKIALLEDIQEGSRVKVNFDLRGNEYNGRYFVNLQAWKIENLDAAGAGGAGGDRDRPPIPDDSFAPADEEEDLPF
jgi:hypothetical protein